MTPEKAMWQAVLSLALRDATSTAQGRDRPRDRASADRWLTCGGESFESACECAGFEPDVIRNRYVGGHIDPRALRLDTKSRWARAAA